MGTHSNFLEVIGGIVMTILSVVALAFTVTFIWDACRRSLKRLADLADKATARATKVTYTKSWHGNEQTLARLSQFKADIRAAGWLPGIHIPGIGRVMWTRQMYLCNAIVDLIVPPDHEVQPQWRFGPIAISRPLREPFNTHPEDARRE